MNQTESPTWEADYCALTSSCGLVLLSNWTQLVIRGQDRVSFLHNMCTNNIRDLGAGTGCEAFCTDVKGKIVGHLLVMVEQEQLTLLTLPEQASKLIAHLERYIIREDVQFGETTSDFSWFFVCGPQARGRLAHVLDSPAQLPTESWRSTTVFLRDTQCLVVATDLVWPGGFLLRVAACECDSLSEGISTSRIVDFDSPAFTAMRVESGFPFYGLDFDSSHLPQEIDRDRRAISFKKGCYLGQETIARIDALGHVNKKLASVKFTGTTIPVVGTSLFQNQIEVGTITSGIWSPGHSAPLGMGFISRAANSIGSVLESELGSATIIAPFLTGHS